MELPRHKLVIFTDGSDLAPIARGAELDGREILIPGDHTIETSIGDTTTLIATVPIIVSDVEYRVREAKAPKQPRAWGNFWPIRLLRKR